MPRVFISYAWEDESYKLRVKRFAARLRENGIDARLDLWHTGEDRTIPDFMNSEVRNADKVLVLCSLAYRRKVHLMEDGEKISGVGWEMTLLTSRIWAQVDSRGKGIPVLFQGKWAEAAPDYLLGMVRVDLSDDATFEQNYLELLRRITGKTEAAPPLGELPAGLDHDPVAPLRGPRTTNPAPAALHTALCATFTDFTELRYTLSLELGDNLNSIAANLSLEQGAYEVIRWAETRGRTADLITALAKSRSGNPQVQALVPPPSPPKLHRVFKSKLPAVSPLLIGREKELKLLDDAWADPAANVVQIIASGGTGKTALMDKWFHTHIGEAPIFGWSFYSQGASEERSQTSSDPFFGDLLRWLGITVDPTVSVYAKAEAVAERLRAERVLLLLDGLEPLQDTSGEMKDPAMKALLGELDTSNAGLVVCTTRVRIAELPDDAPRAQAIELDNLTAEAGGTYLERLGVRGWPEELREASKDYGNHALALTLLGKYLARSPTSNRPARCCGIP